MSLQEEIDEQSKIIRTDSYSMSIGELMNLYNDGEIDIHPEFQRFFRWTPEQKSKLIESILLGIPLPPIFVAQRQDGIWDVVDGLQRLSTIFQFLGILQDEEKRCIQPLILEKTKYLPSLEDKKWGDHNDLHNSFTETQRLYIKRSKLDIVIVLKESDETSKYELFQRLNTGGSPLSDQEVRNCILIVYNAEFYQWLRNLSSDSNFEECVALTERVKEEQYDLELVVRFIVFRTLHGKKMKQLGDIGEFLTDTIVDLAKNRDFHFAKEEEPFKKTFELLNSSLQSNAFRRYDSNKGKFVGGFLISAFEAIALGIGYNYNKMTKTFPFESKIKELWRDPIFTNNSGSGVRASQRIPKIVPLGRRYFA